MHIVADFYVGHSHIKAHVLLIGVPFAYHLGTMVVSAEWHDYTDTELPIFPIIREIDNIDIFTPTDFLTPKVTAGFQILIHQSEPPVGNTQSGIPAPVISVKVISGATHILHTIWIYAPNITQLGTTSTCGARKNVKFLSPRLFS